MAGCLFAGPCNITNTLELKVHDEEKEERQTLLD